ncbi:MAG: response regulator [Hyphomicrobiales bacterium]|nr:MAG: response regulator [Hyphomicrobiales bacterium]
MPAKILIVEDEIIIGMETEAAIEDLGHTSIGIAATAMEALQIADAELPDIAFVDVNLADGPTGPRVGAELAKRGVAVVFITANPRTIESQVVNAIGVLDKPVAEAELADVIAFLTAQTTQPPARLRLL